MPRFKRLPRIAAHACRAWLVVSCLAAVVRAEAGSPAPEPLEVSPAQVVLRLPRDRAQLVVTRARNTTAFDVTHVAAYRTGDAGIVRVDEGGVVHPLRAGQTQIYVEAEGQSTAIPVTVSEGEAAVSFLQEVLPALTKAGCNSGKCHGSPTGKGGFALSLRGFDPEHDLARLTRESGGRRANRMDPWQSLLLAKPTAAVPHGGGQRFPADDPLAALLAEWIAQSAPGAAEEPAAERLEIIPASRWLEPAAESQQLTAVVHLADGSHRDVTHLAHLSLSSEEIASISPAGLVHRRSTGEVIVAASYGELHATSQIVFLPPSEGFAWPNPARNNEIDALVFDRLRRLRIPPSELADDATFHRRAHLDVCGIVPSVEETRAFLSDTRPDKRERLIDDLLGRPEYADFWAMKWSDRLGSNQRFVGKTGALKYHAWIRHQVASNVPEDEFARAILTASGGNYSNPPASFYRLPRTPEDRAEHVAQVFMGVRIGCARCHNHPAEAWTQDDYYGLAAFFARIKYRDGPFYNHQYDKEETIVPARSGEVQHARTRRAVPPRPLGEPPLDSESDVDSRREQLANWLTSPENPFFARAAVNRVWQHLFGRGIVEPVDDFRSSNPPSHPELLAWLARDFVEHGFDRKHLIRTIMRSRTYQLSSQTQAGNASDDRYFSHAQVRLLGAEQLLDSIGRVTGAREKFAGFPVGLRAVELPDGEYQHRFLNAFGRPARSLSCACEREDDSNLAQALELVGGEALESKVGAAEGRAARLVERNAAPAEIVEELFLASLGRYPTAAESEQFAARLETASDRRAAAEDLLWALLNHPEFLFQH